MINPGTFMALMEKGSSGGDLPARAPIHIRDVPAQVQPFVVVLAFREPRPLLRRRPKEGTKRRLRLPIRKKTTSVPKSPKPPRPRKFIMVFNRKRGWELPGGAIAEGETEEQAAAREFLEETGYEVTLQERVPIGNGGAVFLARLGKRRGMPRDEDIKEIRFTREVTKEGLAFPYEEYEVILRMAREKGY